MNQCSGRELIDENVVLETTGAAGSERIARLLEAIASHDSGAALGLFAELWSDGKDPAGVLSDLNGLMRDALILSVAPKGGSSLVSGAYSTELLKRFGTLFTREELLHNMTAAQEGMSPAARQPQRQDHGRTYARAPLHPLARPFGPGITSEPRGAYARGRPSRLHRLPLSLRSPPRRRPRQSRNLCLYSSPLRSPARAEEPTVEPEPAESSYDEAPPWSDEDAPPLRDGGMAYPAPRQRHAALA